MWNGHNRGREKIPDPLLFAPYYLPDLRGMAPDICIPLPYESILLPGPNSFCGCTGRNVSQAQQFKGC